tara:strand:- start:5431 stop:6147 length:717 start_codon:yes stop_codon:yes gene_type:complete
MAGPGALPDQSNRGGVHDLATQWIERVRAFRLLFIVLANLIPIGGVILLGWDGGEILILYWVENLIIGMLTLPRVIAARGHVHQTGLQEKHPSVGVGCFFVVHYGIFCLVHGVFTLIIASEFFLRSHEPGAVDPPFDGAFLWAVLALAGLNLFALWRDWWVPRAWRNTDPISEMFRPYGRIFVLHFAVLGGAWAMQKYNAPEGAILILCLAKAGLELVTGWLAGLNRNTAPDAPSGRA